LLAPFLEATFTFLTCCLSEGVLEVGEETRIDVVHPEVASDAAALRILWQDVRRIMFSAQSSLQITVGQGVELGSMETKAAMAAMKMLEVLLQQCSAEWRIKLASSQCG
jgi:hypothetical protein